MAGRHAALAGQVRMGMGRQLEHAVHVCAHHEAGRYLEARSTHRSHAPACRSMLHRSHAFSHPFTPARYLEARGMRPVLAGEWAVYASSAVQEFKGHRERHEAALRAAGLSCMFNSRVGAPAGLATCCACVPLLQRMLVMAC